MQNEALERTLEHTDLDLLALPSYLISGNILDTYESQILNLYSEYRWSVVEFLGILVAKHGKHEAQWLAHSMN